MAGYFENQLQSCAISAEYTPGFDQFAVNEFGGVQLRPDSLEYIQLTGEDEKESAFYGELAYAFADVLTATVGYRKYKFDVDNTAGFGSPLYDTVFEGEPQDAINIDLGNNTGSDKGDLYKFNLAWNVSDDDLVYFTYSEGHRNGGVNSVPECTPAQIASNSQTLCATSDEVFVDPDEIENWEIGYKGLLTNDISVSAAVYFIDWVNLQVSTTTVNGGLPITGNGSTAESKGLELQTRWYNRPSLSASLHRRQANLACAGSGRAVRCVIGCAITWSRETPRRC